MPSRDGAATNPRRSGTPTSGEWRPRPAQTGSAVCFTALARRYDRLCTYAQTPNRLRTAVSAFDGEVVTIPVLVERTLPGEVVTPGR